MPKSFDPDKARNEAQAVITGAQKRKETLNAKVEKAKESVKKATDRLTLAEAAVASVDGEISRAQRYLDATADLDTPVPEPEPADVAVPEPAGAF